jgi:glycosyltransferase involved in cell wall biosynthesis
MTEVHFIVGSLDIGGAERHLSQLLPALKEMGFSVRVILLSNKAPLKPIFEKAGITVVLGPNLNFLPAIIRRPLSLIISVTRLILNFLRNPKAIHHSFLPEAYLLTAFAARLAFFKGSLVMSRRSLNNYRQRRPALQLEKLFYRFTTMVLGNSKAVVQQLYHEGFRPEKVRLIYNGIETEPFKTLPSKRELRKTLGLNSDSLIFIIVANLIPYKGHIDLLNAFAIISQDLPQNWLLLCVGKDVGTLAHLKNHASILGIANHVKFLGSRSDTVQLLAASDIGILCSHEEGFSNAILEGMAAGLPMVVTKVGGNAEAVQDMTTGLVVEPKNPEELADALLTFALAPKMRHNYGNAGKERVHQHFTLPQCTQQYADFYRSLSADFQ